MLAGTDTAAHLTWVVSPVRSCGDNAFVAVCVAITRSMALCHTISS
jgi:hypothetical protein